MPLLCVGERGRDLMQRNRMALCAAKLHISKDDDTELSVDTPSIQKNRKPLFKELAALTKAGYVSYQQQGFIQKAGRR